MPSVQNEALLEEIENTKKLVDAIKEEISKLKEHNDKLIRTIHELGDEKIGS